MRPSEHMTEIQIERMLKPTQLLIDELRKQPEEARIRMLAGLACFFNVSEEVIERIERAGRTTAKLIATGAGAPKRG